MDQAQMQHPYSELFDMTYNLGSNCFHDPSAKLYPVATGILDDLNGANKYMPLFGNGARKALRPANASSLASCFHPLP